MARPLLDVPSDELLAWLRSHGQKPMRARQIRRWLLEGRADTFDAMTDLPRDLRAVLAAEFSPFGTAVAAHRAAEDGTHKLVLRLQDSVPGDGRHIECVLIQENTRRTACISTQIGCGMGCVFCASGLNGVIRNLTTGEILEQLLRLRNLLPAAERLTNVVVMGMGEPLANLDRLIEALDVAGSPDGLNLGARHVTISTVGLPTKIRRLADLGKQYHLAISLHAPNDPLRSRIVPTNPQTGIPAILEAADYFVEKTGRQVTWEYVMLRGLNDTVSHARELITLLRGRVAHVNLIPFNEVDGLPYRSPRTEQLTGFVAELRRAGLSVKVRKRKGAAIDAACGQLRRRTESAPADPGVSAAGSNRPLPLPMVPVPATDAEAPLRFVARPADLTGEPPAH